MAEVTNEQLDAAATAIENEEKKIGRPTVMTPAVVAKLEAAFSYGATDREACFYAGVSVDALYDYCIAHPEFSQRKEDLKDAPIMRARETVVKALRVPQHAQWYLSRKRKKEFSERIENDVTSDDKPLTMGADVEKIAAEVAARLKADKTK